MPVTTYPAPIERVMTPLDQALLRDRRRRLLRQARGRVLELGGAGGVNLEHYPAAAVTRVVVVGADAAGRSRLQRVAARRALEVELRALDDAGSGFDTIVAAFILSARSDLHEELRALAARLSDDGRLLFIDHSPRRPGGLATELSRPLWRLTTEGFVPGRDLPAALRHAGFTILSLDRFGLPTLTLPLRSCVAGMARRYRPDGAMRVKGEQ
ncbi:MAG TPA: methyltransferase domain-containing protein [Acidimicrobiales bacterium]|nr:methyltransferase domain-containing protein [Acidimicrobiales bacterium]